MPLVWLLLLVGAPLAAVALARRGERELDLQALPATVQLQALAATKPTAGVPSMRDDKRGGGINVWGHGGTWEPRYLRSLGCKDLRWGVCFEQWRDDIEQFGGDGARAANTVAGAVVDLLALFSGAGKMLIENACVQFRFPLRSYEREDGEWLFMLERSHLSDDARALARDAPPHPLPARVGWSRVWVQSGATNRARIPDAVAVLWPTAAEYGPSLGVLATQTAIRSALRYYDESKGQLRPENLAGAAHVGECDKPRWWLSRKSKAAPLYK